MEINTAQLYPKQKQDTHLVDHSDSDINVQTSISTPQPQATESGKTTVSLSTQALTMLDIDNTQNDKTHEQKTIEYELAQKEYQAKVNSLPVDYRKMKVVKDRIDEEIKILEAEVSKIKQSITLNEEERDEKIAMLEQQIAAKSLAVIDISKEFTQKLKEQERSKQISPESATDMLKTFNSSPPEAPEAQKL